MKSEKVAQVLFYPAAWGCKRNTNPNVYWSGGATPAHGMSAKRVERAALARLVLRPSVRPYVRHTQKGPKRASELLESIRFFSKSEQVKTLLEGPQSRLAKC